MTLDEVKRRLGDHFAVHDDGRPTPYLDEAVMTMFAILDYAQLLTDKFGSLEQALEAEKVVHCKDCGIWNSEKEICNKPCESMKWRRPDDYCCDGRLYERKFVERVADAFSKVGTVNPISPVGLRAALKLYDDAMNGEDSNESLESD